MFGMDEISDYEGLKASALSKLKLINEQARRNEEIQKLEIKEAKKSVKNNIPRQIIILESDPTPVLPVRKFLAEFENGRSKKVQEAISVRVNKFNEFTKQQEHLKKEAWLDQQRKMIENMQQQELLIFKALEQYEKETSDQHDKLVQYYKHVAEKHKKNAEMLMNRELELNLRKCMIEDIKKNQTEFREVYEEIVQLLTETNLKDTIKNNYTFIMSEVKDLPDAMNEIVMKCKSGEVTLEDAKKSKQHLESLKGLKATFSLYLDRANKKAEEDAKIEEANIQVVEAPQKTPPAETVPEAEKEAQDVPLPVYSEKKCQTDEYREFLENYRKRYEDILRNDSLKQFRFDCKKAVNTPVNTISAISVQHLVDKYNRLRDLLSGKTVMVGDNRINASSHPQGIFYCTDLLAEKFVTQGDLMISSNPDAAFCYASVIVALWNDFPDFGKLLLAHFHRACPYTIPKYFAAESDSQTTEDFYKTQGYRYIDGAIEKQDKFLKRMTGLIRLYSTIFITKPRRGQTKNPYGFPMAWRWLTSFLNCYPRPDITATVLHVFLETAGSSMQVVYGKQFVKIVRFIIEIYMPMLLRIDEGGPVTRLDVLLQEYSKSGRFEKSDGILPANFW